MLEEMKALYDSCVLTSQSKNTDYAKDTNPFANFEAYNIVNVSVEKGILSRMIDKIVRIGNLVERGNDNRAVLDESVTDSIKDLVVYSGILYTYISSNLKKEEKCKQ